ncbi:MAG: hypothetical protein U0892_03780 [Pirellulales bacterium]
MSNNPYSTESAYSPDVNPSYDNGGPIEKKRKTGVTLVAVFLLILGVLGAMNSLGSVAAFALQATGIDFQPAPPPNAPPGLAELQEKMKAISKPNVWTYTIFVIDLVLNIMMITAGVGLYSNRREKKAFAQFTLIAACFGMILGMVFAVIILLPLVMDPVINSSDFGKIMFVGMIAGFGFNLILTIIKLILALVSFRYLGKPSTLESMI